MWSKHVLQDWPLYTLSAEQQQQLSRLHLAVGDITVHADGLRIALHSVSPGTSAQSPRRLHLRPRAVCGVQPLAIATAIAGFAPCSTSVLQRRLSARCVQSIPNAPHGAFLATVCCALRP